MVLFLFKASIVIVVLLAFYKLFLEKESFFGINRIYLIGCLVLAVSLPFLVLPRLIEEQGLVERYVAPHLAPDQEAVVEVSSELDPGTIAGEDSKANIQNHQDEVKSSEATKEGGLYWLLVLYFFGVGILGLNLIAQVINIVIKVWKNTDKIVDTTGTIVNLTSDTEPCSFFRYIFINPEKYDYETYDYILAHEQIHVRQGHTIDLLLSELAVVFFWFNPFVWKLRQEVEKNIEYQTDYLLLQQEGIEAEQYQMNLLKVATVNKPLTVTTNYNQSLLKNRILKMTALKSNPHSIWKYAFVAPLVFITLLLINQPEVTAHGVISELVPPEHEAVPPFQEEEIANEPDEQREDESPDTMHREVPGFEAVSDEATTLTEDNIDLRDTAKLDVLKDLAALGDEEAQEMLSELSDIKFRITSDELPDLPHKTFTVAFDGLDLEQRLEVMKCLNSYYSLTLSQKEEVYHVFLKYDLDKPDVLKVLQGKLTREEMDGKSQYPLRGYQHRIPKDFAEEERMAHNFREDLENMEEVKRCKALLKAAREGNMGEARDLLVNTDPNWACDQSKFAIIEAARAGHLDMTQLLLDNGADPNLYLGKLYTPLMAAASEGHLEIVKLLIEKGADINQRLPDGTRALDVAITWRHRNVEEYLRGQMSE